MIELKLTTKKSVGFYVKAATSFLHGTKDKAAVDELQITALGNAISLAGAVAGLIEKEELGTISKISTEYIEVSAGRCAQMSIHIKATRPTAIILQVEIKPEHVNEFVEVITADAVGSRAEPGCLRFDVLKDQDSPNKFTTYEVFRSEAAMAVHKDMPYVKAWGAFQYGDKKPVVNKTLLKTQALNFQVGKTTTTVPDNALGLILQVDIKEDCIDEFLSVMNGNAMGSRSEDGCLRFDLLRDQGNPSKFISYEVFTGAEATDIHKEKPYVKAWGALQYGDKKPVINKALLKAVVTNFDKGSKL